jgi:hypothetical protein
MAQVTEELKDVEYSQTMKQIKNVEQLNAEMSEKM